MSLRLLGAALMLVALAFWKAPAISGSQEQKVASPGPRWEYKVIRLDSTRCSNEGGETTLFNEAGRDGWELVNYVVTAISLPHDTEGSLLIRPAATGPGKQNNPQTADSFAGTMSLKMGQARADSCQAVFKRMWHPAPGQPQ